MDGFVALLILIFPFWLLPPLILWGSFAGRTRRPDDTVQGTGYRRASSERTFCSISCILRARNCFLDAGSFFAIVRPYHVEMISFFQLRHCVSRLVLVSISDNSRVKYLGAQTGNPEVFDFPACGARQFPDGV
jgi:hypothetical protein